MTKVELVQIGDSLGLLLPPETLERLRVKIGDSLLVTENASGVTLTPYSPPLDEKMDCSSPSDA